MNTRLIPLFGLILSAPLLNASSVLLDFNTEGQFADNFSLVSPNPVTTGEAEQVFSGENGYVKYDRIGGSNAIAYQYTPAENGTFATSNPLTAYFDFYAGPKASTFAIIFSDASNLSNNVMALFRLDFNYTTMDQVAFFRDGAVTPGSLTPGTQVGSNHTAESGINNSQGTFTSGNGYSATLIVDGTMPTINLSVGNISVSSNFIAGDANWAETVVSIRLFDNGGEGGAGVGIDNFRVTQVPEPATVSFLIGCAALVSVVAYRRRMKA